ncbi:MAG: saccharopine dehydrogenase NADP-binding domain-containing protein [Anaerolinea sp.]|nr:saccharopine dehydrogenase NADP-binding domain-containing protein [Anaerolinea sp.]
MITVFGATGYTGRLVSRALDVAGVPYRLAGRSAKRLAELSDTLVAKPEYVVVDARQVTDLPLLAKNTRVLINCVGPFTDLGEKVVRLAALSGVAYLDTTNELAFVLRLRPYDELAKRSGAILVPSCGFEVALADGAARLLAEQMLEDAYRRVDVVYRLSGKGASDGTRRSAIRSLATSWFVYRNGRLRGALPGGQTRRFNLLNGRHEALAFPSCETATLPLHMKAEIIQSWMVGTKGMSLWAPFAVPLFAVLMRTVLQWLLLSALNLYPVAKAGIRDRDGFEVAVYLEGQSGGKSELHILGQGVYEQTAAVLTLAARRILAGEVKEYGVLPPSAILGRSWLSELNLQVVGDWNG